MPPPVYVGRYTNGDYGFSVTIPKNIKAFGTPDPAPNHGFGINLSETPYSYLWVDGSYNAAFWTEQDIPDREIGSLIGRGAINATFVMKAKTRLDGIQAIHLVISYKLNGTPMMAETIWALRVVKAEPIGIMYSINLECAKDRFKQDSRIVEALRRSWRVE